MEKEEQKKNVRTLNYEIKQHEQHLKNNPESKVTRTEFIKKRGKYKGEVYEKEPRYLEEKHRQGCPVDPEGRICSCGSFYKRPYNAYTWDELHATQGKDHRMRTVDLCPEDRLHGEVTDDDSHLPSDWVNRTGHSPFFVPELPANKAPNRKQWRATDGQKGSKAMVLPEAIAVDPNYRTYWQRQAAFLKPLQSALTRTK